LLVTAHSPLTKGPKRRETSGKLRQVTKEQEGELASWEGAEKNNPRIKNGKRRGRGYRQANAVLSLQKRAWVSWEREEGEEIVGKGRREAKKSRTIPQSQVVEWGEKNKGNTMRKVAN